MKISKRQLKRVIREEYAKLNEGSESLNRETDTLVVQAGMGESIQITEKYGDGQTIEFAVNEIMELISVLMELREEHRQLNR